MRRTFCRSRRPLQSRKPHKTEKQRSCQKPENSHATLITSSSKMVPPKPNPNKQSLGNMEGITGELRGNHRRTWDFSADRMTFLPAIRFSRLGNNNVNTQHCNRNYLYFGLVPILPFFFSFIVLAVLSSFFAFIIKYF